MYIMHNKYRRGLVAGPTDVYGSYVHEIPNKGGRNWSEDLTWSSGSSCWTLVAWSHLLRLATGIRTLNGFQRFAVLYNFVNSFAMPSRNADI